MAIFCSHHRYNVLIISIFFGNEKAINEGSKLHVNG